MLKEKLESIAKIGNSFLQNIEQTDVFVKDLDNIHTNDKEALYLVLSHFFMRGRNDSLSISYFKKTKKVLDRLLSSNQSITGLYAYINDDVIELINDSNKGRENILSEAKLATFKEKHKNNTLIKELTFPDDASAAINNGSDLLMVLSVLNFIKRKNKNIVLYIEDHIKNNKVKDLYSDLITINQVGDKLITFLLRNIIVFRGLRNEIQQHEYKYFLPIDVWIARIWLMLDHPHLNNKQIKILEDNYQTEKAKQELKSEMIKECKAKSIDLIDFNQGCWAVGIHSLYLLMHNIESITPIEKNINEIVYFSSHILKKPYKENGERIINTLKENNIEYSFIPNTKDIWARDYMPIQLSKTEFLEYVYTPDYLEKKRYKNYISDPSKICEKMELETTKTNLIIDGGNVIMSHNCLIMTNKVLTDNKIEESIAIIELKKIFKVDKVIIIPWIKDGKKDDFGHADGMIRFIDNDTVLLNYFLKGEKELIKILYDNNLKYEFLEYGIPESTPEKNWAYINFLQTDKHILLPKQNIKEDKLAFEQIKGFFPKHNIIQIDISKITKDRGAFNCISWNIKI